MMRVSAGHAHDCAYDVGPVPSPRQVTLTHAGFSDPAAISRSSDCGLRPSLRAGSASHLQRPKCRRRLPHSFD